MEPFSELEKRKEGKLPEHVPESPTSSAYPRNPLFDRIPNLAVKKHLDFDDTDLDEDMAEMPLDVHDISGIRRGLGGLDVADDSMVSQHSFTGASPVLGDLSEESGLGVSPEDGKRSRENFRPSYMCPATPAPQPGRKGRLSYGEVPQTPIKGHHCRSRTSLNGTRSDVAIYRIQEECNVNPYTEGLFDDEPAVERREECRKRPAADMLTPDAVSLMTSLNTPDSGYNSRHKILKSDKVVFGLNSPFDLVSGSQSENTIPTSRYEAEFVELEVIGAGHYGRVTKVRKRLDGVTYAIKRTQEEVQKTSFSSDVVREVFALASFVECNPHVLRYFSSWIEGGHLYIQSEYCDAGTLGLQIEEYTRDGRRFEEEELRRIARQAATGVGFLHEQSLVHLDVKPDNILISHRRRLSPAGKDGRPASATPDDDLGKFIYKIGDLGHVRSFRDGPVQNCVEGDKRYLAPELLHSMGCVLLDAPKADVYSLGVTMFVTAGVGREPIISAALVSGIGQRNGIISGVRGLSFGLNKLFQDMTQLEPLARPTMYAVASHHAIHASKSTVELQRDLTVAKEENKKLTDQLVQASREGSLKDYAPHRPKPLFVGKRNSLRMRRSVSGVM